MQDDEKSRATAESEFEVYLRRVEAGEDLSLEEFCAEHPELADALRVIESLHFGGPTVDQDAWESLGVSLDREDGKRDGLSSAEVAARYCTGCGREIGHAPVCPDPNCATPNFFRDR